MGTTNNSYNQTDPNGGFLKGGSPQSIYHPIAALGALWNRSPKSCWASRPFGHYFHLTAGLDCQFPSRRQHQDHWAALAMGKDVSCWTRTTGTMVNDIFLTLERIETIHNHHISVYLSSLLLPPKRWWTNNRPIFGDQPALLARQRKVLLDNHAGASGRSLADHGTSLPKSSQVGAPLWAELLRNSQLASGWSCFVVSFVFFHHIVVIRQHLPSDTPSHWKSSHRWDSAVGMGPTADTMVF